MLLRFFHNDPLHRIAIWQARIMGARGKGAYSLGAGLILIYIYQAYGHLTLHDPNYGALLAPFADLKRAAPQIKPRRRFRPL